MDLVIAELLTNNDTPEESTLQKARELLEIPRQELSKTKADIAHLEAQLALLKVRREKSERSMNDFQTILSPVRRLPDDLLNEIFYHCSPSQRNPAMVGSEAPLLLTRVCSKWRSLAMSSPRLWSKLHITFCDDYKTSSDRYMDFVSDSVEQYQGHASSVLGRRIQVVKEWLSRSRTCPLSISLLYTSGAWTVNALETQSERDLTIELFKTLLTFSQRWREIELIIPLEIYRKLEALFPPSLACFSSLRSLKANLHQQIAQSPGHAKDTRPVQLLRAGRIERLSVSGSDSRLLWPDGPPLLPSLGPNLTYLCSYLTISAVSALQLLQQCGNLVHCKLYITSDYTPAPSNQASLDTEIPLNGTASLPHLKSLSIVEDITDDSLATRFYASLDAPNIKWLDYQRPHHNVFDGLDGSNGTHSDTPPPIFPLLRKVVDLKKLTIDPRGFLSARLCEALEIVSSSVTHLVVGHEPSRNTRPGIRRRRYPNPFFRLPRHFDLEWLCDSTAKADNTSPSDRPAEDYSYTAQMLLLPHLECLDWSMGTGPDEVLLRFIKQRMAASVSGGVASLKRVWIAYDRTQELDIPAEYARFREDTMTESGINLLDFRLDLDYAISEPATDDKPLSALFGLTPDGRSWSYDDIRESVRRYLVTL